MVLCEGFYLSETRASLMMGENYTNQEKMAGPWIWSQVKQRLFLNKTSLQVTGLGNRFVDQTQESIKSKNLLSSESLSL